MPSTQELSMAVNIPPNAPPTVYAVAAEQCLEWGRPDGALQVTELGLQRHPAYTGLRLFRAEALLLQKRQEQGEEDLRAVLAAEPQHPRALKLLAHLLMSQSRYREVLPMLERAEFILVGDPDIPNWLKDAERGAEAAANAPEPIAMAPAFTPEMSERFSELASMPGVAAVSLETPNGKRHGGAEWDRYERVLGFLPTIEEQMAQVLSDAGFGLLTDMTVHEGDWLFTARRYGAMTVRLAADSRVREGLIAWQCKKVLGEGVE